MQCPLPIDWLEYLEGRHSDELASHLPECVPCQILVEELRRENRPQLRPLNIPKADAWPHWREVKDGHPSFGDIRWTVTVPTGSGKTESMLRILMLLLSDVWEENGRSWCDVVPVSTDIENATSLDLVLARADTDVGIPWRILLRSQTVASVANVGARIGCLTQSGKVLLRQAIEGNAPGERFGTPIEGADDTRAQTPEPIDSGVRFLGQQYALMIETEEERQTRLPLLLSFELHPFIMSQPQTGLRRLAADTAASQTDLLVIDELPGIELGPHARAWITFWSSRLSAPVTSAEFVPSTGARIMLGRDLGIMPREITRLEVRLSDE